MKVNYQIKYNLMTQDSLLKVIWFFSLLIVFASLFISAMHYNHYGNVDFNIGLLALPLIVLSLSYGFRDDICVFSDGSMTHRTTNFYFIQREVDFHSPKLVKEGKYSLLVGMSNDKEYRTRMTYLNALAIALVYRLK